MKKIMMLLLIGIMVAGVYYAYRNYWGEID